MIKLKPLLDGRPFDFLVSNRYHIHSWDGQWINIENGQDKVDIPFIDFIRIMPLLIQLYDEITERDA